MILANLSVSFVVLTFTADAFCKWVANADSDICHRRYQTTLNYLVCD